MMRAIRGRDTVPELIVRRALHGAGLRFRLHAPGLPGKPDIVLPRWGVVVFVHGCFWHRHPRCRFATTPSTRAGFWAGKFAANVARDLRNQRALRQRGWRVLVVWECQLNKARLARIVERIRG
jgi:DNA mismatch endonuclease, patch repair protein